MNVYNVQEHTSSHGEHAHLWAWKLDLHQSLYLPLGCIHKRERERVGSGQKRDRGRERMGIKGCLGQNVLIPNQHQRELLRDFTLFPFRDEDHCPSVTQQNGSRGQLLSGAEEEISVYC